MNSADIMTMIGNVAQSLMPVQQLIVGTGYLLGILMMMAAIGRLKKIGDFRARGASNEKMFVPLAYLVAGSALIFLPSALSVVSTTAFGTDSVLQYSEYKKFEIYGAMRILIRTVGLVWFLRGCVLLVHATAPGVQHGPKGLAFLCAGVMAVNFDGTIQALNFFMDKLLSLTKSMVG